MEEKKLQSNPRDNPSSTINNAFLLKNQLLKNKEQKEIMLSTKRILGYQDQSRRDARAQCEREHARDRAHMPAREDEVKTQSKV